MANVSLKDQKQQDEELAAAEKIWANTLYFVGQARFWYPLYFAILALFLFLTMMMYLVTAPSYTAIATIGPPNPSPISSMLTNINGSSSVTGGFAKRLLGGAGGAVGGNDPFEEYLQLLHSYRLAKETTEKDKALLTIYYPEWDAQTRKKQSYGLLHNLYAGLQRLMRRPISVYTDADAVQNYFTQHLQISSASSNRTSLLSTGGSYINVAFDSSSPKNAENMLNIILSRADNIIRQEQLKDVHARIEYIRSELPNVTQADQREALIETLSGQEEVEIMLVADQRYASTLIDPPHALPSPTSPMPPSRALTLAAFVSLIFWGLLVGFELKLGMIGNVLRRFRLGPPNRPMQRPVEQTP